MAYQLYSQLEITISYYFIVIINRYVNYNNLFYVPHDFHRLSENIKVFYYRIHIY